MAAAIGAAASGCGSNQAAPRASSGSPQSGRKLIQAFGCGACHSIGGISGADGEIGPPLSDIGQRRYIAGRLPNTPANLVRWIRHPQEIEPGSVMPDLGLSEPQARDVVAYLYRH